MSGESPPGVVLQGSFDAAHEKRYALLPFEVPPGARALHVTYEYSDRIAADPQLSGGNTLDIGLFDPRGTGPASPGFRGWSGSSRRSFSVTEAWATPGYHPGPIQPGVWHVLLGLYKVGRRGCAYRVEVRFGSQPGTPEPRPTAVAAPRGAPRAAAEPGWLRGDLHCHTLHSDGDSWPAEMLARAVELGLEFLGVTDHNQTSHHADYARVSGEQLPLLLPGVEVTTYRGHWNAWGTDSWWEFREPEVGAVSRAMRAAAARGALVSVNHPKPLGPPWEYPGAEGFHAVEVWNGAWRRLNSAALAWWEAQLRAGKRLAALGGSDTHRLKLDPPGLGCPTTWAYVGQQRSADGVLAALRLGRAFISQGVDGPQLYLRSGATLPGGSVERGAATVQLRAVGAARATLMVVSARGAEAAAAVPADDWATTIRWPRAAVGYLRAQLLDQHGDLLALTNPLYLPR